MAMRLIFTPTYNFSHKIELPRPTWSFHRPSLDCHIFRRLHLQRLQSPSTSYLPLHPRLPNVSVIATSSWNQRRLENEEGKEADNSPTHELSNVFLDILKQRSESGMSNEVLELEDKDAEAWDEVDGNSFVRGRRGGYAENNRNYEASSQESRSSSTDTEGENSLWSAGERRDLKTWNFDEDSIREQRRGDRLGRPKLTISKSYPSIPAKFSKYTRWKSPNRGKDRSSIVKQQMRDINLKNQPYYIEKSVFFQDFIPPVIQPEQPCQFSYSEHPKVAPIGFRDPLYSPFGPKNMVRPWTGKLPYGIMKRTPREFDSFKLPPSAMTKTKYVEPPGPFLEGTGPKLGRTREEIMGEPLCKDEIRELVGEACVERRQLDLGKDGLTHNMLDLLHRHWKRRRVCRIKCFGVSTVDILNLCRVIEDKSGGKIIRRSRGMLYVFRGRNYNWNTRPEIPLMLWKPPAPIYPPVVQSVPEGLSVKEADNLRELGQHVHCLCRLKRAGVYQNLVKMVKDAFEIDELVKVDCTELGRSDMKKIGAKLRDLVPCVPLSFERHFMLLWKGSKLQRESQDRSEGNTLGAATAPCGMTVSENCEEVRHNTLQNEETGVHLTNIRSNQKDEQVKNDIHTDAEENGSEGHQYRDSTHHGASSDHKSGDTLLHGQIHANQVLEKAVLEFDRLWQEAINVNEAVMLDKSEADLDSVLEKVKNHNGDSQKLEFTLKSWEEKPSDGTDTSILEFKEGYNGGTPLDSPRNGVAEIQIKDVSSETDKDNDEYQSTSGMSKVPRFFSERDVGEYEEDDEQVEKINYAEELLPPTLTDITIPQDELKRLCALRLAIRGWMRIGSQGISRGIVKSIHSKWLVSEIAKVRCIVPGCNMREVHEDLERLTGGIVIWMEGPAVVIYRGKDYLPGWMRKFEEREESYRERLQSLGLDEEDECKQLKEEKTSYNTHTSKIRETDIVELLDGLGPKYTEWTEGGHVPVDGDLLLPPKVGYKSPFRRLPYGVRPILTNFEMTEMRLLAKKLPPHFALGKRRGLEGLASAIVKLWEKSEVAIVAMKRVVSRIDSDRMAAELLRLTGGDLVARTMTYIALFRGNDFLPPVVERTLEEKNRMATTLLEEEERVRLAGFRIATQVLDPPLKPSTAGTLAESLEEKARWDPWQNSKDFSNQAILVRKATRDQAFQRMQKILSVVSQKIARAEIELNNLNLNVRPKGMHVSKEHVSREHVSEEEMYTLRKIGLRMKPYLLLGRREVFSGVVENMHLHWKWRELVKIIVKRSYFMYREKDEVEKIARMLEIESGGVLVGICTIPVGEAIIVYRGKNYQRPSDGISPQGHPDGLRPRDLLTKRQAWQRFNQKRRKLSLEEHLHKLERDFNMLQADLKKLEEEDVNLDNEGGNADTLTSTS